MASQKRFSVNQINKIKSLIFSSSTCMISTNVQDWSMKEISMKRQVWDDEGDLYLMGDDDQTKMFKDVGEIQLFYTNERRTQFLTMICSVSVTEFYLLLNETENFSDALISGDKKVCFVSAHPLEAYYWDNDLQSMISIKNEKLERQFQQEQLSA